MQHLAHVGVGVQIGGAEAHNVALWDAARSNLVAAAHYLGFDVALVELDELAKGKGREGEAPVGSEESGVQTWGADARRGAPRRPVAAHHTRPPPRLPPLPPAGASVMGLAVVRAF